MILTSAALNPISSFLLFFCIFICSVFFPVIIGCVCYFVLNLADLLDYFFLFRLLKSLFRLYSMLYEEKQVISVCSASVGKCFFFYKFNLKLITS